MRALSRAAPDTHIVWLDQVLPMYRKDLFAIEAVIGMVKSTNHRFRVVTVFRRLPAPTVDAGTSSPSFRRKPESSARPSQQR
jgi:hypothetical protein